MRYQFLIQGEASRILVEALSDLDVTADSSSGTTVITGVVLDRAGLRETLDRLEDLGLVVLEMTRIPE